MSHGFLLDTNVLSATSPNRRMTPDVAKARARRWIGDHAEHLWLPMVAVAEIAAGIGKREATGATRHAAELAAWLSRVLAIYPERIMPFGLPEALRLRQLARAAFDRGAEIGIADMMIANIAMSADLVVATRNGKHFGALGIECVNPFEWDAPAA